MKTQGWVPVHPCGNTWWHRARRTRYGVLVAIENDYGLNIPWKTLYRKGWRIVKCDVGVRPNDRPSEMNKRRVGFICEECGHFNVEP